MKLEFYQRGSKIKSEIKKICESENESVNKTKLEPVLNKNVSK